MTLPTEVNPLGRDPLAQQIVVGVRRGGEAQRRELVRQQPVELLGHGPVTAPESRLEVRDRNVPLRRRERRGQRRVHVPHHQHQVRRLCLEMGLKRGHHRCRLRGVAPRADPQVDVRLTDPESLQEHRGHALVVVLAGMDQDTAESASSIQCAQHRSHLHEVGARTHDVHDGERAGHDFRKRPALEGGGRR